MEITRTANAGVMLSLDGKKLLLDGVCKQEFPYIATPEHLKPGLLSADALLFTHAHNDHFDGDFTNTYKTYGIGTVIAPDAEGIFNIGSVTVKAYKTRHLGKTDIGHCSFVINGSKTVWFMGDASPACLQSLEGTPDVIIAPFAYANTASALKRTLGTGAKHIIIVHLPEKIHDSFGLRDAVLTFTAGLENVYIPGMEETLIL